MRITKLWVHLKCKPNNQQQRIRIRRQKPRICSRRLEEDQCTHNHMGPNEIGYNKHKPHLIETKDNQTISPAKLMWIYIVFISILIENSLEDSIDSCMVFTIVQK